MAHGKPQLKFERNPWNNFRNNRCHGRTTDDGRISISWALLTYSCRANESPALQTSTGIAAAAKGTCCSQTTIWIK